MLKRLVILLVALAVMVGVGVATTARAGGEIDGEMVYRWNGFDNYDQNSDVDDGLGFSQLRTRVGFGDELGDNASFRLVLENYRVLGDPEDVNTVYQASFTVNDFLFDDFDVTFGRMPVAYGRERVIGMEDWALDPAERTLFEGYHGRYNFENGWFDHFNFKLDETYGDKYEEGEGDTDLAGFYLHYDANEDFWFEPYAMLYSMENYAEPDVDNDRMFVFGALVDYMREGLHFYGEAVVQTGTDYEMDAETDISALGWYAGLFYDFEAAAMPYIGFEYDYASGQDPDSADREVFGSPFGSSRNYLGIMNIVPWSDLSAMRFAGGFMPVDGLDIGADFFVFSRDQELDGKDKIGTELDINASYLLNADVELHGGVGLFSYDEDNALPAKGAPDHFDGYVDPGDSMLFGWFGASVVF